MVACVVRLHWRDFAVFAAPSNDKSLARRTLGRMSCGMQLIRNVFDFAGRCLARWERRTISAPLAKTTRHLWSKVTKAAFFFFSLLRDWCKQNFASNLKVERSYKWNTSCYIGTEASQGKKEILLVLWPPETASVLTQLLYRLKWPGRLSLLSRGYLCVNLKI